MERLKSAVQGALTKRSLSIALKKEQMECVSSIVDGRDVLAVLPTGYGKSLIFQLLPDIYDHLLHVEDSVVLVISPLNALMHDQIAKLSERGISACMIQRHGVMVYGKEDDFIQLPLEQLANPKFQLIYMHPEVCVHERKVISFFNSSIYQERVRCVVVDEAHLVLNWDSFRPAYGKLDVLVSIFPKIPHLATTATATLKSQRAICDSLQLKQPVIISVNPDRRNIFFESKERPATGENKLFPILHPLCVELLEKKIDMPLTLIYGTLDVCAESFLYFCNVLGENQYFPCEAPPKSENRLFSQYHAEYPQHEKDKLISGLINNTCKARVLFVTVAFGIGVDVPSIRRVIHIGVPRMMEEYFQEVGRAGRDGLPAAATIYYNRYDLRTGKNTVEPVMKELVSATGCKRKLILNYFGHDLIQDNSMPVHSCCDNDAAVCDCDECIGIALSHQLQESSLVEMNIPGDEDDCSKLLSISYAQKVQIRNALEQHMQTRYFGPSCVGGMSLATGFTPSLVDKTIECCEQLVSVEAVEHLLPVFSKENATVIFDIVRRFSA